MLKNNRNLLIVALVAVVNALGYGVIIPILYSYSQKYGLSDFENGLLFATFSLCQFIATPIIGRLSDKYGRRPALLISIAGTAISFFLTAVAPNVFFLFFARALDGITAGNFPVISAVISDSTEIKDRARGFGLIGAAFGFGFIFGPAISALTVSYWIGLPFVIAGVITTIALILAAVFLPETNKHMGEVQKGKLFDFKKLFHAMTDENVGFTLLIALIYSTAFSMFIFAFQPFVVKVLHLSPNKVSIMYTLIGLIGLITQIVLLPRFVKAYGDKKVFRSALTIVTIAFVAMFFMRTLIPYILTIILFAFANTMVNPLIQTILSKETDERSQGTMQGISTSYVSLGQILGPVLGGVIATIALPYPFLFGALLSGSCIIFSFYILRRGFHKESAF